MGGDEQKAGAAASGAGGRRFLGHPRGLLYIAVTEAWNAFALYGMLALLTLYMVSQALLPGHVETIIGFASFRVAVESVFGPMSVVALASQIFGLYAGLICFTPLFGGFIADRWIGQRRTVMAGALLMLAGHSLMAWERSFLIALLLLVLGSGCITGNLKAQVGGLYGGGDPRRQSAFAISLIGINVGAFAAPLICGAVAALYGWSYGFAAAAAGMAAGLAVYLAGSGHLPPDSKAERPAETSLPNGKAAVVPALLAVVALNILFFGTYNQTFNIFPLWASEFVDRDVLGFTIPAPWFLALDGLFAIIVTAAAVGWWKKREAVGMAPNEIDRIGFGFALLVVAFLTLAAAGALAGAEGASIAFTLLFFFCTASATLLIWTSTLALISRGAPPSIRSTMIGAHALAAFAGNMLVGWMGRFYEPWGPIAFWLLHAGIAATGLILLLILARPLMRHMPG